MSSIEALKEQARRHEQNEEWAPARDLYLKAIDRLADESQPDIGLHNRVGDILVKLGDYEGAVKHFMRATDLYVEAELPNNAIAVCKKVTRHLPNRSEIYLRMGQIRAAQGFLVDARENFLTYAAKVEEAGDHDEALRALVEFAELAPEDTGIRMSVGEQLQKHERPEEALAQFAEGYRVLVARGDEEGSQAFADRILSLDPAADLDDLARSGSSMSFESTAIAGGHGDDGFDADFGGIGLGGHGGSDDRAVPDAREEEPDVVEVEFGEIVVAHGDPDGGTVSPVSDDASAGDKAVFGDLAGEDDPVSPPGPDEEDDLVEVESDLPFISFGDEVDDGDAGDDDLPMLDVDGDEEDEAPPLVFAVHDESESVSGDDEAAGSVERALEGALEEASGDDRSGSDWERLERAYDRDRPDTSRAQQLVELAFQRNDPQILIRSYELLAEALESADEVARARSVWEQVLSLDPDHRSASAALGTDSSFPEGETAEEPAPAGGFVDLGSLIFGDEKKEKTTRFRVAYEEPSGDEAADFARMLDQFKAKVADSFDASDVKAHHDLGTAYKEMGLLDEAVTEFQQALRASATHLPTYELLGQTFMDRGEHAAAVRVLERALKIPSEVEDELIGIYYYLGRAHEELGQTTEALDFYDRVFALDINFADVTARLRELR